MNKLSLLLKSSAIVFGVFLFSFFVFNTAHADISQTDDSSEGPLAWHQNSHYVVQTINFTEMFADNVKVKLRHGINNPATTVRAYIYPTTVTAPPNLSGFCASSGLPGCYGADFAAGPIATSPDVVVDATTQTEYTFDFNNPHIESGWHALVLEIILPAQLGSTTIQTAGSSTDVVSGFRWEYTFDGSSAQYRLGVPDL